MISISIVSHNQSNFVADLLGDICQHCRDIDLEVILTLNVPESLPFQGSDFPFPIKLIQNQIPKGFGENHNAAFKISQGGTFCVLNPDIRFESDPFETLIRNLNDIAVGVAAPVIVDPNGRVEDSARRFPTPWKILAKALGHRGNGPDYPLCGDVVYPDWVGGMFMLFRSDVFREVGGFNEHYFLYYEDVDLCARLQLAGYKVLFSFQVKVIHDAQRTSHRNLKYLKWHFSSMVRFFLSYPFWAIMWRKIVQP